MLRQGGSGLIVAFALLLRPQAFVMAEPTWLTLPLYIAAILMIYWIVHEVLPYLNEQD
jgi:hypothetical protein